VRQKIGEVPVLIEKHISLCYMLREMPTLTVKSSSLVGFRLSGKRVSIASSGASTIVSIKVAVMVKAPYCFTFHNHLDVVPKLGIAYDFVKEPSLLSAEANLNDGKCDRWGLQSVSDMDSITGTVGRYLRQCIRVALARHCNRAMTL
jgi:hypothetical protein